MNWNLKNKNALITGGTKGIGLAIAEEFITLGANVCIVARTDSEINAQIKKWQKRNIIAKGICADVSILEKQEEIKEKIDSMWGSLDILVNNAAMNIRKDTTAYSFDEYNKIFNTNLTPTWNLLRILHPLLKKNGASVINISSVGGSKYIASGSIYSMTKAAMEQLNRYLSVEWAKDNIRINCVSPWYTKTPLAQPVLENKEKLQRILDRTPLNRIAEPSEVAKVVAFLAMPESSYVTGVNIPVDGGFSNVGL